MIEFKGKKYKESENTFEGSVREKAQALLDGRIFYAGGVIHYEEMKNKSPFRYSKDPLQDGWGYDWFELTEAKEPLDELIEKLEGIIEYQSIDGYSDYIAGIEYAVKCVKEIKEREE